MKFILNCTGTNYTGNKITANVNKKKNVPKEIELYTYPRIQDFLTVSIDELNELLGEDIHLLPNMGDDSSDGAILEPADDPIFDPGHTTPNPDDSEPKEYTLAVMTDKRGNVLVDINHRTIYTL